MRLRYSYWLIIVMLFSGCSKTDEDSSMTDSISAEIPDQESWNSEIIITNAGRKVAVIDAGHLSKFKNKKLTLIDEGLEVDFFDAESNHVSRLTSVRGEVDEKTNNLTAIGNVVAVSDSGITLYTEILNWDNKREKIVSEVKVMLTTETDTLYGIGFESDASLANWTIKKPSGVTTRGIND